MKIKLPSGIDIEIRDINGKQWRDCLDYAESINPKYGTKRGILGYWERYEEYSTGWTVERLGTMSKEDAQFLREYLLGESKVGPAGSREKDSVRKN